MHTGSTPAAFRGLHFLGICCTTGAKAAMLNVHISGQIKHILCLLGLFCCQRDAVMQAVSHSVSI